MRTGSDLAVVALIATIIAYAIFGAVLLVWVTVPASLAAAVLGMLAGVALVFVRMVKVLGRSGTPVTLARPGWLPPDLRLRTAGRPAPLPRDRGWPEYFSAQVLLDLDAVVTSAAWRAVTIWLLALGQLLDRRRRIAILLAWPVTVPVAVALVGLTVGTLVALAVCVMLFATVTAAAWLVGVPLAAALQAADRMRRPGRTTICPRCYHVTDRPAYRCPGPHPAGDRGRDLHYDLRPGRLGVLYRRCRCGARLPTSVSRAARTLKACCPACTLTLPKDAAVAREVRIPVFGAALAGKTHLVVAAVRSLLRSPHAEVVESLSAYGSGVDDRFRPSTEGGERAEIPPAGPPMTVSLLTRGGRRRALVHIFDAAGDDLVHADHNAELAYLEHAHTFVFVLDPSTVPGTGGSPAGAVDTEEAYHALAHRLRQYGAPTGTHRLAFVVSKADLLVAPGNGHPDSSQVHDWLVAQGLDNMVLAAQRDFKEVRYFQCSARGPDAENPLAPFAWLLAGEGVRLAGSDRPVGPAP